MVSHVPRGRVDYDPSRTMTYAQRVARERSRRASGSKTLADAFASRGVSFHDGVTELDALIARGRGGLS